MELSEISLGATAQDSITGSKGKVTAKVERLSGDHQVLIEGADSTGRAFEQWSTLDRINLL